MDTIQEFTTYFKHNDSNVIDINAFAILTGHNIELANSLILLFKAQMAKYIIDFKKTYDINEKIHLIHAIKGASRCISAKKLADITHIMEQNLRENIDISKELMDKFISETTNVMSYIQHIELKNLG